MIHGLDTGFLVAFKVIEHPAHIALRVRLDSFFPTTAHFARIFSTVVLWDFEIRTSDLRLRRARWLGC